MIETITDLALKMICKHGEIKRHFDPVFIIIAVLNFLDAELTKKKTGRHNVT